MKRILHTSWLLSLAAAGLTLAYSLAIVFDVAPWLRGPNDWRWALQTPQSMTRLWMPFGVVLALAVLILWGDRRLAVQPDWRPVWGALILVALLASALQVSLLAVKYHDPFQELFDQTITPYDSGFFSVASQADDLSAFLRTYPAVMRQMPEDTGFRPRTHPPGVMVVMWLGGWALDRVPPLERSIVDRLRLYRCEDGVLTEYSDSQMARALPQMSLPLVSGLTVLPLFALGKRLWGSRVGFLAAACYPLLPAVNAWPAFWDAAYPFAMCLALLTVEIGLQRRRPLVFLVGGLVVSAASWMSFGNLMMGAIAVFYGFVRVTLERDRSLSAWMPLLAGCFWFALGVASIWLIYWAGWGVTGWDVYAQAIKVHTQMYRPYWTYLVYNLYDLAVFLGLPAAVYFVAHSASSVRAWAAGRAAQGDALILSWVAVLVGLDVSGITRGEVPRLWLFLTPVMVLVGVRALISRRAPVWAFVGLLAAQTVVMSLSLQTAPTDLREPIQHTPGFAVPSAQHTTQARLGGRFDLLGYDLSRDALKPGKSLDVTLYWKSVAPSQLQYTVFAHLLDSSGKLAAQQDAMPRGSALPTSCWVVSEVVSDTMTLSLPTDASPGVYTLQVGMYYLPTGERLPVTTPGGVADRVVLQTIRVDPR
jgi:hypothetical protein